MSAVKETSRTFDHPHGAVFVVLEDQFGNRSNHTFYVAQIADVDAEILKRAAEVEVQAQTIRQRMMAAGWTP